MRQRDALIAGAAIAALLLWTRRAAAHGADVTFPEGMYDYAPGELPQQYTGYHDPVYDPPADDAGQEYEPVEAIIEYPGEEVLNAVDWFHGAGSVSDVFNRNTDALLDAIIAAENYPTDVVSGRAYNVFYGGSYFSDMSDHPVITGEKQKVELPERYCRAAGYSGKCYSTAAGALQINVPTWLDFRGRGGPYLRDFSPESQREVGRRILNAIGALKLLQSGDFDAAVARASARWASLPASTAGQAGRKSMAYMRDKFAQAGGTFA